LLIDGGDSYLEKAEIIPDPDREKVAKWKEENGV
jgi:hypothetical protein